MQDTGAYHHSLHRTLQENPSCSPCNHATHDNCALSFDNVQNEQNPQTSARNRHTSHLSLQRNVKSTYGNESN